MIKVRYTDLDFNGTKLKGEMSIKGYKIQYGADYLDVYCFDDNAIELDVRAEIQTIIDAHDSLLSVKEDKIVELKALCDKDIEYGFDSTCFDGVTVRHYSLSSNDQTNILGSMMKVSMGITPTYKWDNYIGICFDWTSEQMMALITKMGEYITEIRDKYAILKKSVLDTTTEEEINNIEW